MSSVKLRAIAVARGGDKGGDLHMPLLVFDRDHYDAVREQVTADRVHQLFLADVPGGVERFEVPNVCGLNFILHGALEGGRTRMLKFDYRFSLSERLLDLDVEIPD